MNASVKSIQTDSRTVFMYWLEFLKPYHKLANKEVEALSILLYYRWELSKEVTNMALVDKLLFSSEIRLKVREDLGGMKSGVFNNLLTTLRRKGVLSKDNKIIPALIPNIKPDSTGFKLIFDFEINDKK
jgi:hypothetical protein|tara:strand:- start:136 stop:522 length:387 start_codon:yes stop_codon:yes gene_type:complete